MRPRAEALAALAGQRFDVLVVGGGITGAGVALDAATRGLSVALVERGDYACGTSSRSSKLIHGGLRYLRQLDFGVVRESLLERRLMVARAPHLVRPLPFVVPAFGGRRPDRRLGVGLSMYDAMAVSRHRGGAWSAGRHRVIDGAEVLALAPALAPRAPSGGYLYYDCQADDVRLVLTILGAAERFGAVCANRVAAVALRRGEALVRDVAGGGEFPVRAAHIVDATGVWAGRLGPAEPGLPALRPSRGTHVVVPGARLPLAAGVIAPAGDGRSIFVLPWLGETLVGTTDHDYDGPLEHVRPAARDVAYLLQAVNACFGTALGPGDLAGAFAGVRPLVAAAGPRRSVDISRKPELHVGANGVVTITGGKLTTWRRMAKLAVDRVTDEPCRTHAIPLGRPVAAAALARVPGVAADAYEPLAARYGEDARAVLALVAERPELGRPVLDGHPDLLAEAVLAVRREQAQTLADVLLRRTRLGLIAARALAAPGATGRVAAVLGDELGWDAVRVAGEVEAFAAESEAEGTVVPAA
jgi:glycerol-3-phosphate dehydrogenase